MNKNLNYRQYDLEDRTFNFAKKVREFTKNINKTISNVEDIKQLVRASGSVGANYIEANEALSKKDFILRIKISRKESIYWLKLLDLNRDVQLENERKMLIEEATELLKIFGAIYRKSI